MDPNPKIDWWALRKSGERTDNIYLATENVNHLARKATALLGCIKESDYLIELSKIRSDYGLQSDCYSDLGDEDWEEMVGQLEGWCRAAVCTLLPVPRTVRLLLDQTEDLPKCLWKNKYRILVREQLADIRASLNHSELFHGFEQMEEFIRRLRPHLKRLEKLGRIANRIQILCGIELVGRQQDQTAL